MTKLPSFLPLNQLDLFPVQNEETVAPPVTIRRRVRHQPQGNIYNLETFFETINRIVFKGALGECTLRWSRNRWKITLGLCDVKSRTIILNRCLDDARVPDVVVASVVHHEMLHLHFGVSEGPAGGRRFHTPQFRMAEKLFPGHAESEKWISQNWPLRGRPAIRPRQQERSFLAYLALMYA